MVGLGGAKPTDSGSETSTEALSRVSAELGAFGGNGKSLFFMGRGLVPFLDCNHKLITKHVTNKETHRKRKEKSSTHNSTTQAANVLIWSLCMHTYVHTLIF